MPNCGFVVCFLGIKANIHLFGHHSLVSLYEINTRGTRWGNVVYVDMPEVDDEVEAGEDFGAVESVKAASDLYSPVSGTVVEVNEALEDAPELINQDAFANWIIKVELSDKSELDNLMDAAAYEKFVANP